MRDLPEGRKVRAEARKRVQRGYVEHHPPGWHSRYESVDVALALTHLHSFGFLGDSVRGVDVNQEVAFAAHVPSQDLARILDLIRTDAVRSRGHDGLTELNVRLVLRQRQNLAFGNLKSHRQRRLEADRGHRQTMPPCAPDLCLRCNFELKTALST
eukprot:CAMPEP_0177350530 /NCGR_PEP_ID=MMETSP0368-20130122/31372_1 /TAXON_ID=447022 ORGANISM="Scrippsiella hangoei-like, Strain SHHI-4" /NCGR_SAMPLE_ID=MMETSP0368 /ASSEMBLY_ACC=CAM_ASM_000363 /LENGTH=155 /DNA_ID=CAMNT_0018812463 /DNA_START=222 /DNA_END=689 /DNA_ORIENTATION=+